MERVTGIGGVFWRAKDPKSLGDWYEEHLGLSAAPGDDVWRQEGGLTIVSPFAADTTYFARPEQTFMLNFRVRDLDAMVAQLRSKGVTVEDGPQSPEVGRFARLHDPDGNAIELWEPRADLR